MVKSQQELTATAGAWRVSCINKAFLIVCSPLLLSRGERRTSSHGLRGVLGPGPEAQELKVVVVVVVAAAVGNSSNHRHHHNFENCHQNTRVLYQSPEQSAE